MWINKFLELVTLSLIYSITFNKLNLKYLTINILLAAACSFLEIVPIVSLVVLLVCYSLVDVVINKGRIIDSVIRIIVSFIIVAIAESIVVMIVGVLNLEINKFIIAVLQLIIFSSTILLLKGVRKKISVDIVDIIKKNKKFAFMIFINIFIVFLVLQFLNSSSHFDNLDRVIMFTLLLSLMVTGILLGKDIAVETRDNEIIKVRYTYSKILEEYFQKLRANEHEYKNHLNAVYSMLEIGSDDDIRKRVKNYINESVDNDLIIKLTSLDNQLLRAVVYSKICDAERLNIKINYKIRSSFRGINLSETDQVVLLTNLLDNAIEAASNSEEKHIYLEFTQEYINNSNKHIIIVRNTVSNIKEVDISELFIKGYSTKGEERGFGLYNVKEILNANNGEITIEKENNAIIQSIYI